MTINVDTDIDLNLEKLDELISKLELIEKDKSKMINFLTISEFSAIRKCSIATAQRIFKQKSFPSERVSESKKLRKYGAIKQWYMTKHDKNEEC